MADLAERLKRVPLFSRLGAKDREGIADQMSERRWAEGEIVVEEGRGAAGFFLIEEGNVTVSRGGDAIRTLGPGDYFGEIALLDEGLRSATVTAATDLRCRGLAAWELRPFLERHPAVAWSLLQAMAARLRDAEARAAD